MNMGRSIPIVIGVGDVTNRSSKSEDAIEPMQLMLQAISKAIEDTQLSDQGARTLRSRIDSLDVIRTWSWPYSDLPKLLCHHLGVEPRHKKYSEHCGNQPAKLLDDAARRLSLGQNKVAVLTGGEALASLSACVAAKKLPPPGWTRTGEDINSVFSPTTRELGDSLGAIHSIGNPIQVYPLYENGLRAHLGQSMEENNKESAQMYAEFAKVAEQNPYSWSYGRLAETAEGIGSVTKRNRMICWPYPLLMNAFNTVNLAAACILTTTDYAQELGVPQHRWIYPLGGAGTSDSDDFWERPNFYSSPSISRSLDTALDVSGLGKDDIDLFDFYSCFPVVPKIACRHLGLSTTSPPKPITLLGGLTSFGGAGNNYSMHAISEMVRQLRGGNGRHGLVLANGGLLTHQHVICLSSQPPKQGSVYPQHNALPERIEDIPLPSIELDPSGLGVVETYTVEFNRDNTPLRAYIIGRLKGTGKRFLANHGDTNTLQQLSSGSKEPTGALGNVYQDPQNPKRNLFVMQGIGAKL